MGKKFAKIDEAGFPVAFYDDEINEIPDDAFEISDSDWQKCIQNQGLRKFENGVLFEYTPPSPTIADQSLIEIHALESTITPRRIREAIIGSDNGWLVNIEEQIAKLRAKL